ncbi:MAG: hypothetical protein ACK4IX_15545, partial [Candidatus Sericytochromatia bacterium]
MNKIIITITIALILSAISSIITKFSIYSFFTLSIINFLAIYAILKITEKSIEDKHFVETNEKIRLLKEENEKEIKKLKEKELDNENIITKNVSTNSNLLGSELKKIQDEIINIKYTFDYIRNRPFELKNRNKEQI